MNHLNSILIYLLFAFSIKALANPYNSDSIKSLVNQSKYNEALVYLESYQDSMALHGDSSKIKWLISHGSLYSLMQNTDSAYRNLLEAKNIAETINSPKLLFEININLIELYRKTRLYEKGIDLVRKNLSQLNNQNDQLLCRFYHRAAAVYNEMNYTNSEPAYLDTAIWYSQKSLDISVQYDMTEAQATSLNELGNIYEKMERMDEAIAVYGQAIELWRGIDLINYANALKNKGHCFLKLEMHDSSIHYFDQVLPIITGTSDYLFLANTYWGLKMAYKAKGDSLNYYKYSFLDANYISLNTERKFNDKIHDLTIAYETQEKDALIEKNRNQIKFEQQQTKIILFIGSLLSAIILALIYIYLLTRKKNAELNKLLAENNFLVGESNHRIKNNLQLIISIIGREIHKSDKNKEKLIEISDKINSIAALHQHLYINHSKENITISDYLDNIIENFNNAEYFNGITLEIEVEDIELSIDKAVYLGLLITELITNTIKHAFPIDSEREKNIYIGITKIGNSIELLYEDSGKGLSQGEDPSLINLLSKQLKADVKNEKKHSYSISIKFKA